MVLTLCDLDTRMDGYKIYPLMTGTLNSILKLFRQISPESLTKEKAELLVTEMLKSTWMKRFQLFADHAVILIELYTLKYLYVSPSIKNIIGFEAERFTGFNALASLISPKELEIMEEVSNLFVSRITELALQPHETSNLHSTRNTWVKKKDGTEFNLFQHGFTAMVNEHGKPLAQLLIISDITSYNATREHFYSLTLRKDDGTEDVLLSGTLGNVSDTISTREQEILKLISLGYSSKAISERLHISTETVKTHRKNLLGKTNCKNGIDLVRFGYAHGWL
jgi:DNA-binding CsgD family transcriptional regulator